MSDKRPAAMRTRPGAAWRRWEMATFDADAPRAAIAATVRPQEDIECELEQLRQEVREQAQAQGYAHGRQQGLQAGEEAGLEQGRKQGYEAGLAQGHAAGLAAGRDQAAAQIEQLRTLAASCSESIGAIESEMGQALISLSIRIAEQVLRTTLDEHPEKILDLVRDIVLLDLDKDAALRLRVHPADLALIQGYMDEDASIKSWRIEGDKTIERGGCIAQTALGNIDATLATRWQRVVAALGHGPVVQAGGRHDAGQ